MQRRKFLKYSALVGPTAHFSGLLSKSLLSEDLIVGHNDFRYKVDRQWGSLDSKKFPVNDCHEMVVDKSGRIFLLTNETKNNVLIYNKDGSLIGHWGTEYPGAHGLTIKDEGGEEFLYIADNNRHEIIKTTLDGRVIMTIEYPADVKEYSDKNKYVPTETAIADNGDIYVADGYGQQFIMHYNAKGELLNVFGGRGEEEKHFDNAHGICIDTRSDVPTLLITARNQNKLKRFTLDGGLLNIIDLPGAYICRPVIRGDNVYLATIWSYDRSRNTGFVSVLDKNDKLVSTPGGSGPLYDMDNKLSKLHQTIKLFDHPHDVCVDDDENVYVAQWNAGQVYPYKLIRV